VRQRLAGASIPESADDEGARGVTRRHMAGTGWKMNIRASEVPDYAERLLQQIGSGDTTAIDMFVLPPFTSLGAAAAAFGGTPVAIGGQNMHWDESGAWTGEISASMLLDSGCRYVALAHSERLQHFGETYERVRSKVGRALAAGLTPVICLGETAEDRRRGSSDDVLAWQVITALAGHPAQRIPDVVLAYEPRWAIGGSAAASPEYVQARHAGLRALLCDRFGAEVASRTRILYGGSVTPDNGPGLVALDDVDGLFVGRAAWSPEGFARIVAQVVEAARAKAGRPGT
jgi:triosephosphate isomerase